MEGTKISKSLRENEAYVRQKCENCADILIRPMKLGQDRKINCLMVYIEVAVYNMMLDDSALGKMVNHFWESSPEQIQEFMKNNSLGVADVRKFDTMEDAFAALLAGNAIFFVDGYDKAMKISSKGYPNMGVSEVQSEKVIRGSREGFTDSTKVNSALVRKRLRDTRLKVEEKFMGVRSNTLVQILYIEDLVHEELLEEVKERLDKYEIDGILDTGMLEQLTEESWISPFPQYQTTERPDRAAQELLNGKIVMFCDNSPSGLILPSTFQGFMESSEDWYNRFEMTSFLRVLRYFAMLIATLLPGLYLAVIRFHTQILPENLILSFAEARAGVPFSSIVELVLLELSFELIREAVIIVALTALGSMAIPNEEFASGFRILKYGFLFLGGYLGIFGLVLGIYFVLAHLGGLLSFGIPYLVPFVKRESGKYVGNGILRPPFRMRKIRPLFANANENVRLKRKSQEEKKAEK